MSTYVCTPLDESKDEIRILTLLPGTFDEALEITIEHAQLIVPEKSQSQRISLQDLRATLPSGWDVYENLEGRYISFHGGKLPNGPLDWRMDNSEYGHTTWIPDISHLRNF